MNNEYVDKIFINPGIECGMSSYLNLKEGKQTDRLYAFEMYIIKALTIIYGEKSIILPYNIDNENAFKCNLLMYGIKESQMEDFIKYMNDYYNFMNEYKSERRATGLIDEIEKILLDMISRRSKKREFTQDELNEFDTVFNPLNGELKKLKDLIATNRGLIIREWQNQKEELTGTQIRLKAINPNLLDPKVYFKYGYDIKTIASLTEQEINEVNNIIIKEENKDNYLKNDTKARRRLVLSTGSTIIDLLVILSIIATELMVGFIVFSSLWG